MCFIGCNCQKKKRSPFSRHFPILNPQVQKSKRLQPRVYTFETVTWRTGRLHVLLGLYLHLGVIARVQALLFSRDAPEPQSDTSKQVYIYQLPQLILLENRVGPQKRGPEVEL